MKQLRTLKEIKTTVNTLIDISDNVLDYLTEAVQEQSENTIYFKQFEFIVNNLFEIEKKIEYLMEV